MIITASVTQNSSSPGESGTGVDGKADAQEKEIEALKKQVGVDKGNSILEDPAKGQGAMLLPKYPKSFFNGDRDQRVIARRHF